MLTVVFWSYHPILQPNNKTFLYTLIRFHRESGLY